MRMIRTVICIISHTHTCWVCTFSCLSRERAVHYMIVLIPIVFPYTLVSNCYHSWSFANIIVLCRLGSVHVVFLSYYYRERTKLICKMFMIRSFPNKNWCEFQNFHIRPRSAVDSAQWDWGIRGANLLRLCPSLTMPNLLPNEDELTIQLCTGDHSWSFLVILTMKMTMTIYSNSVLLMHVASASQHKGFEHVQKLCVPIVNNFHSCLCALKKCNYCLCHTAYVLYSSHSQYYFVRACNISDERSTNVTRTLSTYRIFILLLSRKNWAQMKNLHHSCSPQQELARISIFLHSSTFENSFGTVGLGHKATLMTSLQAILVW